MPDPKEPATPAAKAPVAPAANPPAAAPTTLAIDERFARSPLTSWRKSMRRSRPCGRSSRRSSARTWIRCIRICTICSTCRPRRRARIEKLEAANFVTPEDLHRQAEQIGDAIAEKFAPKMAPVIQPAINVVDPTIADRLTKIESKLRFF